MSEPYAVSGASGQWSLTVADLKAPRATGIKKGAYKYVSAYNKPNIEE